MTRPRARFLVRLCLAASASAASVEGQSAVTVREGVLVLPTYAEGPPDPNPPFDLLQPAGRPNYPYTIRDQLTDRRQPRAWRALFLENAWLSCSVLPDLGGHLYSCTDRRNGQELFYANTAIKLSNIAYRGSWAAFGIEFNFPVSHNWMTTSPVDAVTRRNPDGSASILVGNTDRPYGMRWLVELTLRPGRAALDQRVVLTNPSPVRQRFYWWTNAAVRAFDDSRIEYPMRYTASHGFTEVDRWPVDARGTDNRLLRNQRYGPVSRFSHGSREGFMAVWHPSTDAGVAHYAPPDELPAKKIWSWGVDADALDWRRALSDDSSAYVEIQAGLFRDQETYAWLAPHDRIEFTETWLPLRGLGGVTRVTPRAALYLTRDSTDRARARLTLNVTDALRGARLTIGEESRRVDLTPRTTFTEVVTQPAPLRVTLTDAQGREVIAHLEDQLDTTPDSLIRVGPQGGPRPAPAPGASDGAWLTWGAEREVNGDRHGALAAYQRGLEATPTSLGLQAAAGRLAVTMERWSEGRRWLTSYLRSVPADHEAAYYLGLAHLEAGDRRDARLALEFAQQVGVMRPAAIRALARLDAEAGQLSVAGHRLARAVADHRELLLDAAMVLRAAGGADATAARVLLRGALQRDPASVIARWEQQRAGTPDVTLAAHLAADPERVLLIATRYLEFGLAGEASAVLEHPYPPPVGMPEPGVTVPSRHPIVGYFAAYARHRRGLPTRELLREAAARPMRGVFPHGAMTRRVLTWVLETDPDDHAARALLAAMDMQRGELSLAIARWDTVRARGATVPALHRNLAMARLLQGDTATALSLLVEGTRREPDNWGNWSAADSLMQLRGVPAVERAALLDGYPDRAAMPTALVYRHARALVAAERFDEAEALFADRWFSRVEGGTNPRGVWLELRARRAMAAADAGRCDEARAIVARLTEPVTRRPFTQDGMAPFLTREPVRELLAGITARCR